MTTNELAPIVVFLYARRKVRIASVHDITKVPELNVQRLAVVRVAKALKRQIVRTAFPESTYRRKRFTDEPSFKDAVGAAQGLGAPLVIGDIFSNLSSSDLPDAVAAMQALDLLDFTVLNATDGRTWSSYSTTEKQFLAINAAQRASLRSAAIKKGLPANRRVDPADMKARQKVGARKVAVNADRRASELADVVIEIFKTTGESGLSPTIIAQALNEKGVTSPRGKQWSPTTAKRLLNRLQKAGKFDGLL